MKKSLKPLKKHEIAWSPIALSRNSTYREIALDIHTSGLEKHANCGSCEIILVFVQVTKTEAEWEKTAADLEERCNVFGEHIAMQAPSNSGSVYYNLKDFHSFVLAAVDALYKFICSTWEQMVGTTMQGYLLPSPCPQLWRGTPSTCWLRGPSLRQIRISPSHTCLMVTKLTL